MTGPVTIILPEWRWQRLHLRSSMTRFYHQAQFNSINFIGRKAFIPDSFAIETLICLFSHVFKRQPSEILYTSSCGNNISPAIRFDRMKNFKSRENQLTKIDYFVNVSRDNLFIQHPSNECMSIDRPSDSSNNQFTGDQRTNEWNDNHLTKITKKLLSQYRWWHSYD